MSQRNAGGGGASTAALKKALESHLEPDDLGIWFRDMTCSLATPEHLEVELPNGLYVDWVERHFRAELEAAAREAFGPVKVTLKCAELSSAAAAKPKEDAAKQALRTGVFMKIYYSWFDHILPQIGVTTWSVFETLLRFVWRGETHVDALRQQLKQNRLVAYVSVTKLAGYTQLNRRTVQRQLRKLEQLGIIETIAKSPHGRGNLYLLGHLVDGEETWLADRVAEKLQLRH